MRTIRRICSDRPRADALVAVALAAACSSPSAPPPLRSCADPIGGVWATEPGATPAGRWHLLDGRARIDGYPIERELPDEAPGTLAAPALLELRREHGRIAGTVVRRWQRGGQTCIVRAPAQVRGCADDRLSLQLGPTGAPTDWTACTPTGAASMLLLRRAWP